MRQTRDRWLDISIRIALVVAVALIAFIGYSYWASSRTQAVSSPSGRAIENLRKVVQSSPGNPTARVRLAEALAYAGRQSEAIEQFDAALKLQTDFIPALTGLATIAMQQKDYPTAETYWRKIIALLDSTPTASSDPRLDSAYYGLGVTYVDTKRWEDAVNALKEANRVKSDASDTHYMLSVAYAGLDFPDKQLEELKITIAFDPYHAQANYDLGMLALKAGDVPVAAELFRVAADHAPDGITLPQQELDKLAAASTAAVRLGRAGALVSSDPKGALADARVAAALDPQNIPAVRLVARLWMQLGDKEKAHNAFNRLLELSPKDPEATEAIRRLNPDGK